MNTPKVTELPRRIRMGRLLAGALVSAGVALAAASPAMADKWNNPGHHKHWKHNGGYYYTQNYYYPRPNVVYVQPQPVYYVQPAPVYVAPPPPPPVYYVQPAPVYHRPSINIVLPIHID